MPAVGATPNSSFTAYATGADLVANRDWRQWADCMNDDGTRPASSAAVVTSAGTTDSALYRALRWASAEIEAAVTVGQRYRPEDLLELFDLQTIPTNQGGDGSTTTGYVVARDMIVGLCCDLAFWWMWKRRKPGAKPAEIAGVNEALDTLDRLRLGERVFPIRDAQNAGLAATVPLDSEVDLTTAAEPLSSRASRFFGSRR